VVVETGDLSPAEFKMTWEERRGLYESGYRTTVEFLPMRLARQASSADVTIRVRGYGEARIIAARIRNVWRVCH
jgi:hypothetical protein